MTDGWHRSSCMEFLKTTDRVLLTDNRSPLIENKSFEYKFDASYTRFSSFTSTSLEHYSNDDNHKNNDNVGRQLSLTVICTRPLMMQQLTTIFQKGAPK